MSSDVGPRAVRVERWAVSWLPGRLLDRQDALAAMTLADIYAGEPAAGSSWWLVARELEQQLGVGLRGRTPGGEPDTGGDQVWSISPRQ